MKDSSKKWKIKIQRMQLLLQHRLVRLQKKAGSTGPRATKELPEKPQILHSWAQISYSGLDTDVLLWYT